MITLPRYSLGRSRAGFTLVEILSVIGVLALLTAIILPVVVNARRKAYQGTCLINLRQLGQAFTLYAQDYDGTFVPLTGSVFVNNHTPNIDNTAWCDLLTPYVKGAFPLCPLRDDSSNRFLPRTKSGYAMNYRLSESVGDKGNHFLVGKGESRVDRPSQVIGLYEARVGVVAGAHPDTNPFDLTRGGGVVQHEERPYLGARLPGATRHQGRANYAFLDGHVQNLEPGQISATKQCEGTRPCFGF